MIRFISRWVAVGAMLALLASVQCFASCQMRSCNGPAAACHHERPRPGAQVSCPFAHLALDQRVEAAPVSASFILALGIRPPATVIPAFKFSFTVSANSSPPIPPSSIVVLRV